MSNRLNRLPAGAAFSVQAGSGPPHEGGPLASAKLHDNCAPVASETKPRGTVLYIEDNPVNALLVEQVLHEWNEVRFLLAGDGKRGIELARGEAPDLVLLDMHLPDMTGLEILLELRADERTKGLCIVALSASATSDEMYDARSAGVDDYWTKPLDPQPFLDDVRRLLVKAREDGRP